MTPARMRAVVIAALLCGAGVVALVLTSDREDAGSMWAVFGPLVMWSFVGTGLYASRARPEPDERADGGARLRLGPRRPQFLERAAPVHDRADRGRALGRGLPAARDGLPVGGACAGTRPRDRDRGLCDLHAASIPAMLFGGPEDLGCDDCPSNVLLIERHEDVANIMLGLPGAGLSGPVPYRAGPADVALAANTSARAAPAPPVYVCGLVTLPARDRGHRDGQPGRPRHLGGQHRGRAAPVRVSRRAAAQPRGASRRRAPGPAPRSCARRGRSRVQAGDAERRRLERDLHDGAQSRLVGIAALLVQARKRVDSDAEATSILERAQSELQTSLGELRELARGIHPAVLTGRGLDPAAARARRTRVGARDDRDARGRAAAGDRSRSPLLRAARLTNVAKYAQASGCHRRRPAQRCCGR